jgi:hypothetical protein
MEPSADAVGDEPAIGVGGTPRAGAVYRSRRGLLTPADVRWQDFLLTRFGRRGFDTETVRRFLPVARACAAAALPDPACDLVMQTSLLCQRNTGTGSVQDTRFGSSKRCAHHRRVWRNLT